MNLESITSHLAAQQCGIAGKTIFVNEMPSACDVGILLMDAYSGTAIDPYLPDYYLAEFRLIIRHTDFKEGVKLIRKAARVLKAMQGTVGTMLVNQCRPLNLPRSYRRSAGGYWEFEVDIDIVFVDLEA